MESFYQAIDPYLIWFFRLTGRVRLDFFLGNLAVAGHAILLGECTSWAAYRVVGRHLEELSQEARHYHDLSLKALEAGDRPAYDAANRLANEAFQKVFYMQVALSATFFWPVFPALAWLQWRFFEVEYPLPGVDFSLSYLGVFVLAYLTAYVLWKALKKRLWAFLRGCSTAAGISPAADR